MIKFKFQKWHLPSALTSFFHCRDHTDTLSQIFYQTTLNTPGLCYFLPLWTCSLEVFCPLQNIGLIKYPSSHGPVVTSVNKKGHRIRDKKVWSTHLYILLFKPVHYYSAIPFKFSRGCHNFTFKKENVSHINKSNLHDLSTVASPENYISNELEKWK